MADKKSPPKQSFEELMRNAGGHRRTIAARAIENERRYRLEMERIAQQRTHEDRAGRVQRDLRRHAEALHIAALIEHELVALRFKLDAATDSEERILLRAEIAHLSALKVNLGGKRRRKPPESGIPVPAIPPSGPLPKQGGAAAPLEFDS
ncbi:MAG: hypothetical protein EAY70_12415 [Sphingomonadales bacterium]|nr:MAG: hypothetical protein EAY70_12415 [Sphingomonadales bacterium]